MSILVRLGLVLRSYLRNTSDRLDRIAAEEELREAAALKKAREEMKSASAAAGLKVDPSVVSAPPSNTRLAADLRLLGLTAEADLDAVEAAWRRLAQRADPKRFPAGSADEKKAAEILGRLNESYERLREALNPTEGRFGQLEL